MVNAIPADGSAAQTEVLPALYALHHAARRSPACGTSISEAAATEVGKGDARTLHVTLSEAQTLVGQEAYRFRHQLIREALRAEVGASRTAWLHRQAARS